MSDRDSIAARRCRTAARPARSAYHRFSSALGPRRSLAGRV